MAAVRRAAQQQSTSDYVFERSRATSHPRRPFCRFSLINVYFNNNIKIKHRINKRKSLQTTTNNQHLCATATLPTPPNSQTPPVNRIIHVNNRRPPRKLSEFTVNGRNFPPTPPLASKPIQSNVHHQHVRRTAIAQLPLNNIPKRPANPDIAGRSRIQHNRADRSVRPHLNIARACGFHRQPLHRLSPARPPSHALRAPKFASTFLPRRVLASVCACACASLASLPAECEC